MIRRMSLVWKRPEISVDAFRRLWLGEHADLAKRLKGLRGYEIAFPTDGDPGMPDGIATTVFDSQTACREAFSDPQLREPLLRTRDEFASRVIVSFVEDVTIVPPPERNSHGR